MPVYTGAYREIFQGEAEYFSPPPMNLAPPTYLIVEFITYFPHLAFKIHTI